MIPENEIFDITIIGGGPVGLFAAFYAGLRRAKIKIIESLDTLGGQPQHLYPEKIIYDIPAYPTINGQDLTQNLLKQIQRFPMTLCLGEEATTLSQITTEQGDSIYQIGTNKDYHFTRAIVIAAGNGSFVPRTLNIIDSSKRYSNLYYHVNDLTEFQNKKVVICGGGDSAVDFALMVQEVADKVTLVHRRQEFRALESNVSRLLASEIEIVTPYTPTDILIENHAVKQLIVTHANTQQNQTLELDKLIVAYGFSTSLKQIKNWGFDFHRNAIKVNSQFETNLTGIFAIGDVASYDNKVKIIATGFGEAPVAINNAMKFIYPDQKILPTHSTEIIEGDTK